MSQHYFTTEYLEKVITVVLGFDRPLGHIYMTIFIDTPADTNRDDEFGELTLYSNLEDAEASLQCLDVNYYRRVLARLNIIVPETMFSEVMRDQNDNVGNRVVTHQIDGAMQTAH